MIFQVNKYTVTVEYAEMVNRHVATVSDSRGCYVIRRILPHGRHPLYRGIVSIVDYSNVPDESPANLFDVPISIEEPCKKVTREFDCEI